MFGFIKRFGGGFAALGLPLLLATACGGEVGEGAELGSLKESISAARINVMSFNAKIPGDSGERSWANRLPRIAGVINSFADGGPHLIGFQELIINPSTGVNTAADIWASLGHAYWFYPLDRGDREVIAIYVRDDRFTVLDYGFRHVTRADRGNCTDDDPKNRPIQYVLVRDKTTDEKLYFFNTHYPSGNSCGRRAQSAILVHYVHDRAQPTVRPIIVGDFNDGYEANGHRNGSMEVLALNEYFSAMFSFRPITPPSQASSYMTCTTASGDCSVGPAWSKTNRVGKLIDHVFVQPRFDVVETGIDRSMFRRSNDERVVCENVVNGLCTGNQVPVADLELYSDHWAVWASVAQ
jgi:endonuclease/exonuclease/phosphatase family metal-dependent hydrolase